MHRTLLIILLASLCHHIDLSAQLKFSEIIALNNTGELNPLTGMSGDWIEIYNSGSEELNISQYYLSDRAQMPFMWRFPENTIIPANTYLVVWADGTGDTLSGLHTYF
jgi:hypothetical protein